MATSTTVPPNPHRPPPLLDDIHNTSPTITLSKLQEWLDEGEAFLAAQPGWSQISTGIDAIMSQDEGGVEFDPKSVFSQTRTNRIGMISEQISAMLTDTKPFWDYTVANRRFEQHAMIYGKLSTFWYMRRNIDLRIADTVKYWLVGGAGYLHLYWDPEIGDINACAEDPRNVIPIRPTANDSLESCMGVILRKKVPINYIRDRYGVDVPSDGDGSAITWMNRMRDAASDVVGPVWRYRKAKTDELPRIPQTTLYTCYFKDPRVNETSSPREMGEFYDDPTTGERRPANNWSYIVQPRQALYPHRRMIVWAGGTILYDGPSFYWHGQFPLIKLSLTPYPWSWFGKPPVMDLLRLQNSLNRLLRVVDDHAAQVAQPGSIHDKNSVARSLYDSFDSRKPGWKLYQNPLAGKGIQIINPPPLPPDIWKQIEWIINEMKELSGVTDISMLRNLGQLPSASTIEAMMNAMTPAIRFRSRIYEAFTRDLAMQLAYNFSQFYTLPMRVTELGPSGVTQDDFDFDPGSMIPDYVHDNDYAPTQVQDATTGKVTSIPTITPEAMLRGPLPRYDRAKEFLRRFVFKISPGSLLNAAQTEQKLVYLQLTRAGWMDIFTLWEALGIPNIGVLPDDVRTIPERLKYQQALGLGGDVNPAGRKASGQEMPRVVTKES